MAERKTFSRYNMRCGMVLYAPEGNLKLDGFEMPELDSRFFVLTAKDIPGENCARIMGTEIPLLADEYIDYAGQPLLVLFGPDYETTELALEKIKIKTHQEERPEQNDEDLPDQLFFSWGLDDDKASEEEKTRLKKTETSFDISHSTVPSCVRYSVLSWPESSGNSIHVSTPMQWTALVRDTVADATTLVPSSIILHPEKYTAKNDEYLTKPAFYAAFTAIAAMKTKLTCEMVAESTSVRTGISFRMTTWSDEENKPKHEEASVIVNQGAYAIAGKEVQRQILTGLLPKYKLESYRAVIRTERSMTAPSIFCGAQLFAAATTALCLHTSRLAAKADLTPSMFVTSTMEAATRFTDMTPVHELATLASKVKRVTDKSDYTRKWASANLHSGEFGLTGYLSGIGLSYGLGIAGVSTTTARENDFKANVTYTAKKNVTVTGTVPAYMAYDKTTKDTLSRFFYKGDNNETIIFTELDQDTPDSGPDVLSTYTSIFLPQLMTATVRLSQLIGQQDPPLTLKFSAQNLASPCEYEFSGFGAAVCEIVINKVSLQPVVKKVWLDIALSTIYGKSSKQKAKSLVLQTLTGLGAELAPDFTLELNMSAEGKEITTFSSIESTVTSLTMSAYTNAIWQATGERMSVSLPAKAKAIEKTLYGGKGEN